MPPPGAPEFDCRFTPLILPTSAFSIVGDGTWVSSSPDTTSDGRGGASPIDGGRLAGDDDALEQEWILLEGEIGAVLLCREGPGRSLVSDRPGEERDAALGRDEAELPVGAGARRRGGAGDRDSRTGERHGSARYGDGAGDGAGLSATRRRKEHDQQCSSDGEAREVSGHEASRCERVSWIGRTDERRIERGHEDVKVTAPWDEPMRTA